MLVTTTITSINKETRESQTKTLGAIRAHSVSLPETFVPESDSRWIKATETRLSVHEHIVTVTH